jgi:hypothetical protein
MGSFEDDAYWNEKYDNAPDCEDEPDHGSDYMLSNVGYWICTKCAYGDDDYNDAEQANLEAYNYGRD